MVTMLTNGVLHSILSLKNTSGEVCYCGGLHGHRSMTCPGCGSVSVYIPIRCRLFTCNQYAGGCLHAICEGGKSLTPQGHAGRERKRVQMVQLAARTRALEQENANLQFMLGLRDSEVQRLRGELASLPRGAGGAASRADEDIGAAATSPTEPAALTGRLPVPSPPAAPAAAPPAPPQGQAPPSGAAREEPLGLVDGLPAPELDSSVEGIVMGVDGQWLRLRRPLRTQPRPPQG